MGPVVEQMTSEEWSDETFHSTVEVAVGDFTSDNTSLEHAAYVGEAALGHLLQALCQVVVEPSRAHQ